MDVVPAPTTGSTCLENRRPKRKHYSSINLIPGLPAFFVLHIWNKLLLSDRAERTLKEERKTEKILRKKFDPPPF